MLRSNGRYVPASLFGGPPAEQSLLAVLLLAGAGSVALLGLGAAALVRRRSRSYALIALALATLSARTAVAGLALARRLSPDTHHLLEHGLDVVMAGLVIAAVYYARTVDRRVRPEHDP